jgi:prepilin-type N-terminal cleavage/methylation domain-containing protein
MPTSSVGKRSRRARRGSRAGVTLLELVIVLAIAGLMTAVSFPAMSSGLDSIRLTSATDSLVSFLNGAMNRAERRREPVLLTILPRSGKLEICTNEPGYKRDLAMPDGVAIEAVLPHLAGMPGNEPRSFLLAPGGTPPAIGIQIGNRRGSRRIVRVDPMTGFPHVESVVKE